MKIRPITELLEAAAQDRDLDWIKESLQAAVQLEFATIPVYLCGMWSIVDEEHEAYEIIRGIVIDEMTHMGLVCNMLTTVGGTPQMNRAEFIPAYPGELPGGVHPGLTVRLEGLTPDVVKMYMEIEKPEQPIVIGLESAETYPTIGKFYAALRDAFHQVNPTCTGQYQITRPGIGLFAIGSLADVDKAIKQITEEGEGTSQSAFTDEFDELAHYYRFQQLAEKKHIIKGPSGNAVFGTPLAFPEVRPMAPVPLGGYPADLARPFDVRFTAMLDHLQTAWAEGTQLELTRSVSVMRELKDLAHALMDKKLPGSELRYGPSFRLVRDTPV